MTMTASSTVTYPHTAIQGTLSKLAQRLREMGQGELADMASNSLDMYMKKKNFYTARISELESGQPAVPSVDEDDDDEEFTDVTSMDGYPHTRISENIARLRTSLQNSSSPQRQERLDLLDRIERDYDTKKAWYVETIESLA